MNKITAAVIMITFFLLGLVVCAHADEVENEIKAGLSAYKKGQYTKAVSSLEFATQQIRQLKAQQIKTLFPSPLRGWSAEEAESAAAGRIFMGGLISGSKKYRKGASSIDINIAADSPMISLVAGILSNPMMLSMASELGGTSRITKVNGEKAIEEWDKNGNRGSIKLVVENKVLVTITGTNCRKSDILDYANAIDYGKIKLFVSD